MRRNLYNEIAETRTQELEMFDAEKERILQRVRKEKKPRRRLAAVLKTAGAVAACFALLVTASVFSPVLAENIPFMENIVAFLKQSGQARSSVISGGAVEDYVTPVAGQEDANFRVTEVYCDGTALVLGYAADFPEADETVLEIDPTFTFDIDGERLEITEESGTYDAFGGSTAKMYRVEDDTFAGTIALDISGMDVADTFTLTVTPESLTGINPKRMVLDARGLYTPEANPLECTLTAFTFDVTVNSGARSVYTVDESYEDFALHTVVTSPGFTFLDISQPEGRVYTHTVEDQNGRRLQPISFDNDAGGKSYYAPIGEDVESLTVTLYDWNDTRTPLAAFTVPMTDGGYALHEAGAAEISADEIVYDPPRPAGETTVAPREGETTVNLGETITSSIDRESAGAQYVNEDATAEITYTNMQVYDSPEEAGIAAEDMKDPSAPLAREGYKFVTFDVDITTNGIYGVRSDAALQAEIDAYENNDGTTGILWISNYYYPTVRTIDDSETESIDIDYFSGHMDGISNYYHFATNAHDKHHFVVGSYVRTEDLESGNFIVGVKNGSFSPRDPNMFNASETDYTYYNIAAINPE